MRDIPNWIQAAGVVGFFLVSLSAFYFNTTSTIQMLDIRVDKLEIKVDKATEDIGTLKTAIITNSNEVKHLVDTQEEVRLTLKELSLELREVHDAILLLAKTSAGESSSDIKK